VPLFNIHHSHSHTHAKIGRINLAVQQYAKDCHVFAVAVPVTIPAAVPAAVSRRSKQMTSTPWLVPSKGNR
jgi:hypothetical protein